MPIFYQYLTNVFRSWRELIECRKYWQGADSAAFPTPLLRIRDESIFSSPRIRAVRKFKFDSSDTDSELVNLFFSFVSDNADYEVEYLECDGLLLTTVPTQLASVMCRVLDLRLVGMQFSKRQGDYMFKAISQSTDLRLKKLDLSEVTFQDLDAATFASALSNVEEVYLGMVEELSEDHMQAVLSEINNKSKSVLKLIHFFLPLSDVRDSETFSKAICKIKHASFHYCNLTLNQLTAMFINISRASELQLHTLDMVDENISGVTPSVLARVICRLRRCCLSESENTTLQLEELCREIVNCKNLSLTQL